MQITAVKRWLILLNVSLSVFMATLDSSIVNIALPVMSESLSVDISSVQWIVTSYLLTISVLLLIWGKISDLYGKKYIFAAGFIIFTLGSLLCGLSQSLGMLVFARIIQAVGASSMMALSQGIVTTSFPPEERGKALGITGTTVAVGSLVGPGLGGILVGLSGWQLIFFINIPIGMMGTVLTFLLIPKTRGIPENQTAGDRHVNLTAGRFDITGALLFSPSILALFMGLLLFQDGDISFPMLLVSILVSALLTVLFIRHETRTPEPLLNLNLFKNPVFSLGLISGFLSYMAIFSILLFMPFYLQNVLGFHTLKAGLIMSSYPVATALVAPVSGWLSDKVSYRPLTASGLMTTTLVYLLLSTLGKTSTEIKIIVLMSLLGVGVALFQSPNNSSIMGSVPRERLGVAGGINALFRNLGMVSGITFSVILFTISTQMHMNNLSGGASVDALLFLKGFRLVMLAAAAVCLSAFLISLSRSLKFTHGC